MNWLDIVILIIITLFVFLGLRRGLIKEVISIIAIGGGIIAGVMFYASLGELFIKYSFVKNKAIANVSGFLLIMFGTYAVIKLIGWVLTKITGTLHLNWIDKIGGGVFGAIKGVIIAFLIISALGFFFSEKELPFKNSILVPYINETFSVLRETIPDDFKEKLQGAKKLVQEKGIKAVIKEAEKVKEAFKEDKGQEKGSKTK